MFTAFCQAIDVQKCAHPRRFAAISCGVCLIYETKVSRIGEEAPRAVALFPAVHFRIRLISIAEMRCMCVLNVYLVAFYPDILYF